MTSVTTHLHHHTPPSNEDLCENGPEVGLVVFLFMEIQTLVKGQLLFIYRAYLFTRK